MLEYAAKMARRHHEATEADVQALRDVGFGDVEILHMIYWIGHFNMANTLSDAVGREVHENMTAVFVEEVPRAYAVLGTGAGAMAQGEILRAGWERGQVRALDGLPLEWINSRPLTWDDVRGRVLLAAFWDASHPNSLLAVPHLQRLAEEYGHRLVVLACHCAEFPQAKDAAWARRSVRRLGLTYPVVLDPTFRKVQGSNNRYWPAMQLIDRRGYVRYRRYGPGGFTTIEEQLQRLLAEDLPPDYLRTSPPSHDPGGDGWLHAEATPELYGAYYIGARGEGFVSRPSGDDAEELEGDRLYVMGEWAVEPDGLVLGAGARCLFRYRAERVYLFASPGRSGSRASIRLRLDGGPLPPELAGPNVDREGGLSLDEPRLSWIVSHPAMESHLLEIETTDAGARVHRFSFLPFRGEPDD